MTKIIAVVALFLAVLFESAVFFESPGIGFLIFWVAAFAGTIAILRSAERRPVARLWMFLPSLVMAYSIFRYDGWVLKTWGAAVCLLFLAWAVAWNLVSRWRLECLANLLPSGSYNPLKLSSHAQESLRVECRWEKETALQVARGSLFAAVLLFVFGLLLYDADAIFGSKLDQFAASLDGFTLAPLLRSAIFLTVFAGALRLWVLSKEPSAPVTRSNFSPTELLISLGSLNTLLAAFLLVQARYLFGDSSLVEALGFNHAEYARRGFFELTICIALILPLVLLAYRSAEVHSDARLRVLGGGLIASAFGLAGSALKRMFLYIDVYGLSIERFYAAAGILVAMTVLGWAAFACLSPRPTSWLVARQKLTVIALLSLLSLFNVDAMVCRSHLKLVERGSQQLDISYISRLSADALPVIEEFEERATGEQKALLVQTKEDLVRGVEGSAGVSFNVARSRVRRPGAPVPETNPSGPTITVEGTHRPEAPVPAR